MGGREAAVCGRLRTRGGAERPYIVVPMPAGNATSIQPDTPLTVGGRVRALQAPYLGNSGVVKQLAQGNLSLETGARLPGAQVEFEGEVAFIPFVNLERLL